jgi:cellulose synthase/poly-beta-1,6-N-acetylglucosamine synthase-like glycosyltransferase
MTAFIKFLFWISVFLIGYSYVLYPLILLALRRPSPKNGILPDDYTPSVSIIVAAYNEEKVIRKRIENLLWLEYPKNKLELIIASDGSSDRTAEIVKEYQAKGIVFYDFKERRGKVNVLNDLVPEAKGEIIVFSDANSFFKSNTINKLVRRFQDDQVGSVCGALHFMTPEGSISGDLEGVYWSYENFLKTVEGQFGSLLGANGALYAVRKELYYPCPPDTIIEDFIIPMKILERGLKNVYEPEAIALEDAAKHIVQEKKRRIRIGAGDFQSIGLLWRMLSPGRGFPALAFWSHKILRWFTPFFMILAFLANVLLLDSPGFRTIFVIQCDFYALAVLGQILTRVGYPVKILSLCYYFVSMNLALFLGFFNYVTGNHSVKWERTER